MVSKSGAVRFPPDKTESPVITYKLKVVEQAFVEPGRRFNHIYANGMSVNMLVDTTNMRDTNVYAQKEPVCGLLTDRV